MAAICEAHNLPHEILDGPEVCHAAEGYNPD